MALPLLASTTISAVVYLPTLKRLRRREQAAAQIMEPARVAEPTVDPSDFLSADVLARSVRLTVERDVRTYGLCYTLENGSPWRIDIIEVEMTVTDSSDHLVWSGNRRIRLIGAGWPLCTSAGLYPDVPIADDERVTVRLVSARIDPHFGPHLLSTWEPAPFGNDGSADAGAPSTVRLAEPG
jgi:hypothetical protein